MEIPNSPKTTFRAQLWILSLWFSDLPIKAFSFYSLSIHECHTYDWWGGQSVIPRHAVGHTVSDSAPLWAQCSVPCIALLFCFRATADPAQAHSVLAQALSKQRHGGVNTLRAALNPLHQSPGLPPLPGTFLEALGRLLRGGMEPCGYIHCSPVHQPT